MSQQGTDNQVQLRRTVDRANRANVSIYAADMRGLQAMVPGGDATQGSRRGTSTFSGASTRNQFSSMAALAGHADDDGGGHRRPRVLRLELVRRGVRQGRRRHLGVLRARLLEHQPGARRPVPPHQGAAEAPGSEARIPLRLLRAARLRALDQGRSRAAAAGSAVVGSVVDRSQRLRLDRLLPPRRQPLLRAAVGRRARLSDSDHEDDARRTRRPSTCSASCATSSGGRSAAFATP